MTRLLNEEGGWAVVTAVVLMAIMLTASLGAVAFVDTETKSSHRQRAGEARLNLTEGALAAQIFQLSRRWPDASGAAAYPETCTQLSTNVLCPAPAQLRQQFKAVDLSAPAWDVRVRDDAAANVPSNPSPTQYYSDAEILARPRFDDNDNGKMWVRAAGIIGNKPRVVVALVDVEKRPVIHPPPAGPFVAGAFEVSNPAAQKTVVRTEPDTTGVVRCSSTDPKCAVYGPTQLSPANSIRSDTGAGPVLSAETVDSLRQIAQATGRYYADCPPDLDPSGDVVFVERGHCQVSGASVNAESRRGIFVIANGTVNIASGLSWWGAIYALNEQGCGTVPSAQCLPGPGNNVVRINGTATLYGGVYINGAGRLTVGSSGNSGNGNVPNLVYDRTVVEDVMAYGNAGIMQNTWRELTVR